MNTNQRPKIDEYDDYIFVILKMVYYDKDENLVIEQVSLVLGDNYVLTFQETEGDVFESVRERLNNPKGRLRNLGTDYLFYALIDAVVDHYYQVSETMGNKIEDLEDDLFTGNLPETTTQTIQILKKELLKIRRAIFRCGKLSIGLKKRTTSSLIKRTCSFSMMFMTTLFNYRIPLIFTAK